MASEKRRLRAPSGGLYIYDPESGKVVSDDQREQSIWDPYTYHFATGGTGKWVDLGPAELWELWVSEGL